MFLLTFYRMEWAISNELVIAEKSIGKKKSINEPVKALVDIFSYRLIPSPRVYLHRGHDETTKNRDVESYSNSNSAYALMR